MRHGLINFVYFMGVPAQILPLGPTAQQLLRYQGSPVAICISFVYTTFGWRVVRSGQSTLGVLQQEAS